MESKDNKNAILVVVLSGIIIYGWNYFFVPVPVPVPVKAPIVEESVTRNNVQSTDSTDITKETKKLNGSTDSPLIKETMVTLRNNNVIFDIDSHLQVIDIRNLQNLHDLKQTFMSPTSALFVTINNKKQQPSFEFNKISDNQYKIFNTQLGLSGVVSINDKDSLVVSINSREKFQPELNLTSTKIEVDDERKANSFILLGDGLERVIVGSEDRESFEFKFKWYGLDYNYYFYGYVLDTKALYKAEAQNSTLKVAPIEPRNEFNYSVVFLKKNYDELVMAGNNLDKSVDFGIWEIIAVPILRGLQYFYEVFQNYGLAIIFLTILMRFLTFPLQYKSFKSMKKMQVIQPELKIIKEKYKDNPKKVQTETMALFKKAGANPIGGCLPMLLQMPIFFAFYKVLFTAVELVDAPFYFWIADLSEKDPFYVLPVLMGLAMFLNMKLTPSTAVDPAQQKVMMLMPVMFSIFMINLPAGLTLYILVSTVVGMLQQLFVFKRTT